MSEVIGINCDPDDWAIMVTAADKYNPPSIKVNPKAEYNYVVRLFVDEVNRMLKWAHGETVINMGENIARLIGERDDARKELAEARGEVGMLKDLRCLTCREPVERHACDECAPKLSAGYRDMALLADNLALTSRLTTITEAAKEAKKKYIASPFDEDVTIPKGFWLVGEEAMVGILEAIKEADGE